MLTEAIVSSQDKERVIDRIQQARGSWITYAPYLDWFQSGLGGTRSVPPTEVPDDVITMHSRFVVTDIRTGESNYYTLVYPEDEKPDEGNLCVLSPMGTALLGARVGQVVHWRGARGLGAVQVKRIVYQPEAAGDHHL